MDFSGLMKIENGKADFRLNPFARSLDAQLISHFPCSSLCPESVRLGTTNLRVLAKLAAGDCQRIRDTLHGVAFVGGMGNYAFVSLANDKSPTVPHEASIIINGAVHAVGKRQTLRQLHRQLEEQLDEALQRVTVTQVY